MVQSRLLVSPGILICCPMSIEPQTRAQVVPKHLDRKMMISSGRDDHDGRTAVWIWMDALARKGFEAAQATSAIPGMEGAQKK